MTQDFDAYHRWLGIAPKHQPPTHYRLLGIEEFESDPEVIADAAERQIAHVRRYALGQHATLSQQILNELSQAKATLLDPSRKAAYDAQLQAMRLPPAPMPQPPVAPSPPTWQAPTHPHAAFAQPIPQPPAAPQVHRPQYAYVPPQPAVAPYVAAPPMASPAPVASAAPAYQSRVASKAQVSTKAKFRNKARTINMVMHVVAACAGLAIGYALLCYFDARYDFLGLMKEAPAEQPRTAPEVRRAPVAQNEPPRVPEPPRVQPPPQPTTPSAAPSPMSLMGRRAGELRSDNALNLKLVWCIPGQFTLGSPADEPGRQPSERQVRVTHLHGYWLGQTEVTQAQWRVVMQTEPWRGKTSVRIGYDYPATYVSWDEANDFCRVFTAMERNAGRLPAGWEYALPTEAQWEYACRAGTATPYHFGRNVAQLIQYAWYRGNAMDRGERYAHRVAQKLANPWGLFDMHGNVREWCQDWYAPAMTGGINPTGPATGTERVRRGGGWTDGAERCRSAFRDGVVPTFRDHRLGFRVALVRTIVRTPQSETPQ